MTLTWPIRKLFGGKPNPATEALELVPKPLKRITFMNKELIKEKEMNNIMREIEQYNIFYPKMIQSMPSNISSMINIVGDGKNPLEELIQKTSKESKMGGFWKKRSAYIAQKQLSAFQNSKRGAEIRFRNVWKTIYSKRRQTSRCWNDCRNFPCKRQ